MSRWLVILLLVLTGAARAQPRVLDDFTDPARWRAIASEGVKIAISRDDAGGRPALRIDFDFVSGAGFCIAQRDLDLELPENYEFAFNLRGNAPANDLEFKLLDAPKGENVWWVKNRAMAFPADPTPVRYRKRHIQFAWGPSGGAPLKQISKLEFAIASATGGKGTVWIDSLTFQKLPPIRPYTGTPSAAASSSAEGCEPKAALDGDQITVWRTRLDDDTPTYTIDFGQVREFGGIVIDWEPERTPRGVDVDLSTDGERWTPGGTVIAEKLAPRTYIPIADAEARFVRLTFSSGNVGIRELRVQPLEFGRSITDTWRTVAAYHPSGHFPRYFTGRQSFWTVTGLPGAADELLINEDGAVEPISGGFSLEPFIRTQDGKLLTWDNASQKQGLIDDQLPVPYVERATTDGLILRITPGAIGTPSEPCAAVFYAIANTGKVTREVAFFIALRPFQVNPPWQFLGTPGGAAPVHELRIVDGDLVVNDRHTVTFLQPPDALGVQTFAEGEVVDFIARGEVPPYTVARDPRSAASAAAMYRLTIEPGKTVRLGCLVPQRTAERPEWTRLAPDDLRAAAARRAEVQWGTWRDLLTRVKLTLPRDDFPQRLVQSVRANLGYILVNMDGPGFQPGSRAYERSWIRDGSMTGAACLEFGLTDEPRRFVEWYATGQFRNGKVPCVIDRRGPDPVPENDSHGQLIYAIAEVHRHTHDQIRLRAMFPRVRAAVSYIQELRAQRMTPEFSDAAKTRQEPGKPAVPITAFRGLLPESISHEGYSAKPMHSYWDQFFTLKGLKDAAYIAGVLGEADLAKEWSDLVVDFRASLLASIDAAMKTHGIDYIPGCVELGDFDATSTAVAITVCGELNHLPRPWLDATFDRYWANFVKRRDDPKFDWADYTPYELRVVGAMVMLGHKDRAEQMLRWFLRDQLPSGWRHWAEIVHRDRAAGKWIGDMPHTWVGSDFLRSFGAMFAYPDEDAQSLTVLAGVPDEWMTSPGGVEVRNLRTIYGPIRASASGADGVYRIHVQGAEPPGGVNIRLPKLPPTAVITLNGQPVTPNNQAIHTGTLPAQVLITP